MPPSARVVFPVGKQPLAIDDEISIVIKGTVHRTTIERFTDDGTVLFTRYFASQKLFSRYRVSDEGIAWARGHTTPDAKVLEALVGLENSR